MRKNIIIYTTVFLIFIMANTVFPQAAADELPIGTYIQTD